MKFEEQSNRPLSGHMAEIVNEYTVKKDGSETVRTESMVPHSHQNVKKEVVQAKKAE